MVKKLAEKEGIAETLKAENQMLWVQRMNSLRQGGDDPAAYAGIRGKLQRTAAEDHAQVIMPGNTERRRFLSKTPQLFTVFLPDRHENEHWYGDIARPVV